MTKTLFLALFLAAPLMAQAPPAPQAAVPPDTSYLAHVIQQARAKADQLATQRADQRADAQYREAVAEIERGAYSDAALSLQAALQRSRNNPKFHGDLGYVYGRMRQWNDAYASFVNAYQNQQQNKWYLLAAAVAKAEQRSWGDAAGTVQLAVSTDSSMIDARLAQQAASWYQQAGDGTQALTWARIAIAKDSTDGRSWLRVAAALNARSDSSPESAVSIRRAHALLPEDKLAAALFAGLLFRANQLDSALERAAFAAQDSSYREFASNLHFEAGRLALGRREFERSRQLLAAGRPFATPAQEPAYANLIARADLLRAGAMLQRISERANCDSARVVDTLLVDVERNFAAGMSYDSARTTMFLSQVVPGYKTQARQAVESSCRAPTPARPPARRRP